MKTRLVCIMDIGPRKAQEDCVLATGSVFQEDSLSQNLELEAPSLVLAVCDGLGGHAFGDYASRFICQNLDEKFCTDAPQDPGVAHVLAEVQAASEQSGLDPDSGSTVAGLVMTPENILVFNAGDSRVYRLDERRIERISHDHSFVQRLVDQKFISEAEAFEHPYKNLVDFGLGPVFADRWANGTEAFIKSYPLDPDSWYLLCSDGVCDVLQDVAIHEALMPDPLENGPQLLEALRAEGLRDNTTFIIARPTL